MAKTILNAAKKTKNSLHDSSHPWELLNDGSLVFNYSLAMSKDKYNKTYAKHATHKIVD